MIIRVFCRIWHGTDETAARQSREMCDVFGLQGISKKVLIIIGRCKRCALPQLLSNIYIDHMVHESGSSRLQQQHKKHIMTVQKEQSKQGRID